jgi:hypothetical protein
MDTLRAAYPWQESYFAIFTEPNRTLAIGRVYEAIAAIEQRRLSPITEEAEQVALISADAGIRKLIAEKNAANWV